MAQPQPQAQSDQKIKIIFTVSDIGVNQAALNADGTAKNGDINPCTEPDNEVLLKWLGSNAKITITDSTGAVLSPQQLEAIKPLSHFVNEITYDYIGDRFIPRDINGLIAYVKFLKGVLYTEGAVQDGSAPGTPVQLIPVPENAIPQTLKVLYGKYQETVHAIINTALAQPPNPSPDGLTQFIQSEGKRADFVNAQTTLLLDTYIETLHNLLKTYPGYDGVQPPAGAGAAAGAAGAAGGGAGAVGDAGAAGAAAAAAGAAAAGAVGDAGGLGVGDAGAAGFGSGLGLGLGPGAGAGAVGVGGVGGLGGLGVGGVGGVTGVNNVTGAEAGGMNEEQKRRAEEAERLRLLSENSGNGKPKAPQGASVNVTSDAFGLPSGFPAEKSRSSTQISDNATAFALSQDLRNRKNPRASFTPRASGVSLADQYAEKPEGSDEFAGSTGLNPRTGARASVAPRQRGSVAEGQAGKQRWNWGGTRRPRETKNKQTRRYYFR